ncbi:MAG: hypothetical protein ABIQ36_00595 [Rhodanobacter sp.]
MGRVGHKATLLRHGSDQSTQQSVDRHDKRDDLGWNSSLGHLAEVIVASLVKRCRQTRDRRQHALDEQGDQRDQCQHQAKHGYQGAQRTVARDLVAQRGGLDDGKAQTGWAGCHQYAPALLSRVNGVPSIRQPAWNGDITRQVARSGVVILHAHDRNGFGRRVGILGDAGLLDRCIRDLADQDADLPEGVVLERVSLAKGEIEGCSRRCKTCRQDCRSDPE